MHSNYLPAQQNTSQFFSVGLVTRVTSLAPGSGEVTSASLIFLCSLQSPTFVLLHQHPFLTQQRTFCESIYYHN